MIAINGDVSQEFLGLKNKDYKLLADKVSIIFHSAASVRFNDPLHVAVKLNTYGTLQVVNLALKMKKLKVIFPYFLLFWKIFITDCLTSSVI